MAEIWKLWSSKVSWTVLTKTRPLKLKLANGEPRRSKLMLKSRRRRNPKPSLFAQQKRAQIIRSGPLRSEFKSSLNWAWSSSVSHFYEIGPWTPKSWLTSFMSGYQALLPSKTSLADLRPCVVASKNSGLKRQVFRTPRGPKLSTSLWWLEISTPWLWAQNLLMFLIKTQKWRGTDRSWFLIFCELSSKHQHFNCLRRSKILAT